ncbi:hypothetical protein DESC_100102 [Desulfosarcina cetonica]|uniref:hypothetical protein n=1 Tax=Desulfosarcina cetonica TaxID=90730 RepID=UPI0006D04912|nr:hypothetical protein [Desulfosarcina cetonica]VTR63906.1 hypothetical protein DESC_100102 [Desulfosarcina cetonica]
MEIEEFIGPIILLLIVYLSLSVNIRTRRLIKEWARERTYEIVKIKMKLWYWFIPWLCGGIHPGNFRVIVRSKGNKVIEYQITGGGLFLLSNKIEVSKIK